MVASATRLVQMKLVHDAMRDRRQHDAQRRHHHQTDEETVDGGKDLAAGRFRHRIGADAADDESRIHQGIVSVVTADEPVAERAHQ